MKKLKIKYNEYSFKTKTEAKWAVYFETLGIKFQYEDYGFDLGNMNYLPDMYLPDLGMWVEIKGRDLNDYEEEKAERLCIETEQPVLLLEGDPALKAYPMLTPAPHLNGGVDPINVNVFKADTDSGLLESWFLKGTKDYKEHSDEGKQAASAYKKARAERFGVYNEALQNLF